MNETTTPLYKMNPAEDMILFGDELKEGMWVPCEEPSVRQPYAGGEDGHLRAQRFRKVTRLRREPAIWENPERTIFVAEWVDGYQEIHDYAVTHGWIVKKEGAAEK